LATAGDGDAPDVGLPVSLILIAVGAILAFAVNQDPNPAVDIDVVGWILMLVGLAGLLLSLLLWERWGPGYFGWHRGPYDAGAPRGPGYPRRRTVVEEDDVGPPGPPGPPPP
jgi:multisubunit Na+/H+ antiporter MnhB subunit